LYLSEEIIPSAFFEICKNPLINKTNGCDLCEPRYCDDCKGATTSIFPLCLTNQITAPILSKVVDNFQCAGLPETPTDQYQIASSSTDKIISESRIAMLAYYVNHGNYSLVKEQLNIPAGVDFSFRLEFSVIQGTPYLIIRFQERNT
jgi:hypothetical protein